MRPCGVTRADLAGSLTTAEPEEAELAVEDADGAGIADGFTLTGPAVACLMALLAVSLVSRLLTDAVVTVFLANAAVGAAAEEMEDEAVFLGEFMPPNRQSERARGEAKSDARE
jgi:hypothetical protein